MTGWGRYIKVKPDAVVDCAGRAEAIGGELGKQVDLARPESSSASAAHGGFATSDALDGCLAAWEDNVRRLAESVTGVGEKLRVAAKTYEDTDRRQAESMDVMMPGQAYWR